VCFFFTAHIFSLFLQFFMSGLPETAVMFPMSRLSGVLIAVSMVPVLRSAAVIAGTDPCTVVRIAVIVFCIAVRITVIADSIGVCICKIPRLGKYSRAVKYNDKSRYGLCCYIFFHFGFFLHFIPHFGKCTFLLAVSI